MENIKLRTLIKARAIELYNKAKSILQRWIISAKVEIKSCASWHWNYNIKPRMKKGKLFVENKIKDFITKAKPKIYLKIHILHNKVINLTMKCMTKIDDMAEKVINHCEGKAEKYMKKFYAVQNVEVPLD